MTTEELKAGRELDERIAVEVMGWVLRGETFWGGIEMFWFDEKGRRHKTRPFSTDLNHSFLVVERMRSLGYEFALIADNSREPRDYVAEFDKHNGNIGETTYIHGERADTPALAICKAALAAI